MPVVYVLRSRINKWDLIKLKIICKETNTVIRIIWQSIDLEKIFANLTSDKELLSNIYKDIMMINFRESNNPIKNEGQRKTKNSQPTNIEWQMLKDQ